MYAILAVILTISASLLMLALALRLVWPVVQEYLHSYYAQYRVLLNENSRLHNENVELRNKQ